MKPTWILLSILLTSVAPKVARAADWRDRGLLFSAGFRPNLETDIRANGIPAEVWHSVILGKTSFDLPEYRKGLYGAQSLSGTSLYALYQMLGAREPWVIAIQVKRECYTQPHLFSGDYTIRFSGTESGGPFSDWYRAHRAKYRALEKLCMIKTGEFATWLEGPHYDISGHDPKDQMISQRCSPVLNDFLKEQDQVKGHEIDMVFDVVNDDSVYIRNPSCISGIKGGADDLFDLIVSNEIGDDEKGVVENLFGDSMASGAYFGGSTLMVMKILAETSHLDEVHLGSLRTFLKDVNAYSRKDIEKPSLSLNANADNEFILRYALLGAIGAVNSHRAGEFQTALRGRLNAMTVTSGTACQGAHGVPKERQAACDSVTREETAKLIELFKQYEGAPS